MAKIGIFYGSSTGNTEVVAEKIKALFDKDAVTINVDSASKEDLEKYPYLIFGTSTWGIGDMQDDWEDFIEIIEELNFNGKKVALFGLGDQTNYSESFVDGMGAIYDLIYERANIIGEWPIDEYKFSESAAIKNGKFVGLAIDKENQQSLTDQRLKAWVEMLKKEFV